VTVLAFPEPKTERIVCPLCDSPLETEAIETPVHRVGECSVTIRVHCSAGCF
jgi:hypothetical protein